MDTQRDPARGLTPATEALLFDRVSITVTEAADVLGIARNSAFAAARNGEIPVIRVGHRLLVPTAKLRGMLGL